MILSVGFFQPLCGLPQHFVKVIWSLFPTYHRLHFLLNFSIPIWNESRGPLSRCFNRPVAWSGFGGDAFLAKVDFFAGFLGESGLFSALFGKSGPYRVLFWGKWIFFACSPHIGGDVSFGNYAFTYIMISLYSIPNCDQQNMSKIVDHFGPLANP